jgi:flavin-binding protein dodecin
VGAARRVMPRATPLPHAESAVPLAVTNTWVRSRPRTDAASWPRMEVRELRFRNAGDHGHLKADHVYKVVEVVGTSTESIAEGARNAVAKAAETLRDIQWSEVESIRGHVVDGTVDHFQVTTKIGFRLE